MKTIEIGDKFSLLTVISTAAKPHHISPTVKSKWYLCRCQCGTEKIIRRQALIDGQKSCGCLLKLTGSRMTGLTHGETMRGRKTKEWRAWNAMIRRCTYPSEDRYNRYGGRGIKVCERWLHSYQNFLADVGRAPTPQHQLDRIDNDGDYEPGNVRWSTRTEQCRNRSSNIWIEHGGRRMIVADWAKETGIARTTIEARIKYGWPMHRLLEPVKSPSPR